MGVDSPQRITEVCDVQTTAEKLAALRGAIEVSHGDEVVEIGSSRIPVVPYISLPQTDEFGEKITPIQYFDYLASIIDSPDDVFILINEPILKWDQDRTGLDQLVTPEHTFVTGGGDCDNISWAAKVLLDRLGCKKGFDYHARVIAAPSIHHAATVYTDESGQLCSIDQVDHKKGVGDAVSISRIFQDGSDSIPPDYFEVTLYSPNVQVRRQVNPANLNYLTDNMEVVVYKIEQDVFDPKKMLPPDWVNYNEVRALFRDGGYIRYLKGVLYQRDFPDGIVEHYRNDGSVEQRSFPDDSIIWLNPQRKMYQKKFPNGDVVLFDPLTGFKKQIVYATVQSDGTKGLIYFPNIEVERIQVRIFDETNSIKEEYYWEDGVTLRQRTYRSKEENYNIVFYDKSGHPIQARTWDGKQVELTQ